jgi:hypothetical protein
VEGSAYRPLPPTSAIYRLCALLSLAAIVSCSGASKDPAAMNPLAEKYVKLVLRVGVHDPGYVDAYYGPGEWAEEAEVTPGTLPELREEGERLLADLAQVAPPSGGDEMLRLRYGYLTRQLESVVARIELIEGAELSFDEESLALYDAVAPKNDEAYFQALTEAISEALPGDGPLHQRYAAFRREFVIPTELLDTVFTSAIAACRERTARYIDLPVEESFTVEYVTDKPWSGYNWYQGGNRSLIQVNTDFPIYIDRAIDLACHEGYPGHHVYNAMLESQLTVGRGWQEFSVYPLFSPQSLIAEGSANYGIEMAFPGSERVEFERTELFPLAGIDPARADEYYRVQTLVSQLGYAGNEAARAYLDGTIDADAAAEWLSRYALMAPDRAAQRVRFIDTYRSYVINYNLGQDLVRAYVEREAGADASDGERWAVFTELLSSPRLPSDLK